MSCPIHPGGLHQAKLGSPCQCGDPGPEVVPPRPELVARMKAAIKPAKKDD
jgi:hypothetical protein